MADLEDENEAVAELEAQAPEESLLKKMRAKEEEVVAALAERIDTMPDVPILKPWLQEKITLTEASLLLTAEVNPETGKPFSNALERLKAYGGKLVESLGHQARGASQALGLLVPEGTEVARHVLDAIDDPNKRGEVVVEGLPGFMYRAAGGLKEKHPEVSDAVTKCGDIFADLNERPEVKTAMVDRVNKWQAWTVAGAN